MMTTMKINVVSCFRIIGCFPPSAAQKHSRNLSRYAEEPPLPPEAIQNLLRGTLSRAKRTIISETPTTTSSSTGAENTDADNNSNKKEDDPPQSPPQPNNNSMQNDIEVLGESALRRAENMLSITRTTRNSNTNNNNIDADAPSDSIVSPRAPLSRLTRDLLSATASQAKQNLSTRASRPPQSTTDQQQQNSEEEETKTTTSFETTDLRYNQNPAISFTALANSFFSTVLRPHQDSVIDATCGNGYDSVGIASLLFSNEDLYLERNAELVCVDVQARACQATQKALSKILNPWTLEHQVQIVQGSHAPLPLPKDTSSVALVVYNLGYLPNSSNEQKESITQVDSTVRSIMDALLLIRIGGMVSVMTYPKTNPEEDFAVRALLEASVLMTNKRGQRWYEYVDQLDCNNDLKELLRSELRRMSLHYEQDGNARRTFRVAEHKKIGLALAPILLTATRIK